MEASVGLMGVIADAALAAGGQVTGVITESLPDHEIAHGVWPVWRWSER